MSLIKGRQQVMSSPNTHSSSKLTKVSHEPAIAVNISDTETTVLGTPKYEDLLTNSECLPANLKDTFRETDQLPTATSFLQSPRNIPSSNPPCMNLVIVHPKLLQTKSIDIEEYASPLFEISGVVCPEQTAFCPSWKHSLSLCIKRCITNLYYGIGLPTEDLKLSLGCKISLSKTALVHYMLENICPTAFWKS